MTKTVILLENQIDQSILQSINNGKWQFNDLILAVPGVYPTEILNSISRLTDCQFISPKILKDLQMFVSSSSTYDLKSNILPSHPLDFTWYFSKTTRLFLLDYAHQMTHQNDSILFLGTPSLLCFPHHIFRDRTAHLIDKHVSDYRTKILVNSQCYGCDLLSDKIPTINTNLVISDPPWYVEYYDSFLWAASKMCSINGKMLLALPPKNIRPKISTELKQIINRAIELGFRLVSIKKNAISYHTPQFERNSLISQGISNFPDDWRKGNLGIFIKEKNAVVSRPISINNKSWKSMTLNGVEIRIKINETKTYLSPSLISIVPNNILNSVSRRNSIRDNIDIWFMDNRIFSCKGPNILFRILQSIEQNKSDIEFVSNFLKRKLKQYEILEIKSTTNQIKKLIKG